MIEDMPSPNTTGSYTLTWTSSKFGSSTWYIQEAHDTGFSPVIATYISSDAISPFTYTFASKPDGTYCYRVSLSPTDTAFSAPKCVTVARPTTAVLRIINNTSYDLVDLRLNNIQKLNYPYVIPAGGGLQDFTFSASGTVSINAGNGFYNSNTSPDIWFTFYGTPSVTVGQTTTITLNNPSIGNLLTWFQPTRNWDGEYWCYNCQSWYNTARFQFTSSGNYTFYDNGVQKGSGTVSLDSWPKYSSTVAFRLSSSSQIIYLQYPFGSFLFQNGPPDWPKIEYWRQ